MRKKNDKKVGFPLLFLKYFLTQSTYFNEFIAKISTEFEFESEFFTIY
jgi:hypothetical protein